MNGSIDGLTAKEIIELRIKCLEPFVAIASKHQIEQDVVIKRAEQAWIYATAPLTQNKQAITGSNTPAGRQMGA